MNRWIQKWIWCRNHYYLFKIYLTFSLESMCLNYVFVFNRFTSSFWAVYFNCESVLNTDSPLFIAFSVQEKRWRRYSEWKACLFGMSLRDCVHHSMEIQPHPWRLQETSKASGSIDEHRTQAWPMRTFHPLTPEICPGHAEPNPPWNLPKPYESLSSLFSRETNLKICNNMWPLMFIFTKIWNISSWVWHQHRQKVS